MDQFEKEGQFGISTCPLRIGLNPPNEYLYVDKTKPKRSLNSSRSLRKKIQKNHESQIGVWYYNVYHGLIPDIMTLFLVY